MKTCTVCKIEKDLSEFHNHLFAKDKKQSRCSSCNKQIALKQRTSGKAFIEPIALEHGLTISDASIMVCVSDENVVKRFVSYVDINLDDIEGCWGWTGAIENGYGSATLSVSGKKLSTVKAHRFMYALRHGFDALPKSIKSGLAVDTMVMNHLCHNRACVNPDHLEVITHGENTSSAKRKPKEPKNV